MCYERGNVGSYGILGMIGFFNLMEENEIICCIFSLYVILEG